MNNRTISSVKDVLFIVTVLILFGVIGVIYFEINYITKELINIPQKISIEIEPEKILHINKRLDSFDERMMDLNKSFNEIRNMEDQIASNINREFLILNQEIKDSMLKFDSVTKKYKEDIRALQADKTNLDNGKQDKSSDKVSEIMILQRVLNELGYLEKSDIDGIKGKKTDAALATFKKDNISSSIEMIEKESVKQSPINNFRTSNNNDDTLSTDFRINDQNLIYDVESLAR